MDFYISQAGDLALSPLGDIAKTETTWRDLVQQAYIRIKTEQGDFRTWPKLGASLSKLYGMPQSRETAEYGKKLILGALNREDRFIGKEIFITAAPTSERAIRFNVYISSPSEQNLLLSINQDLGAV